MKDKYGRWVNLVLGVSSAAICMWVFSQPWLTGALLWGTATDSLALAKATIAIPLLVSVAGAVYAVAGSVPENHSEIRVAVVLGPAVHLAGFICCVQGSRLSGMGTDHAMNGVAVWLLAWGGWCMVSWPPEDVKKRTLGAVELFAVFSATVLIGIWQLAFSSGYQSGSIASIRSALSLRRREQMAAEEFVGRGPNVYLELVEKWLFLTVWLAGLVVSAITWAWAIRSCITWLLPRLS